MQPLTGEKPNTKYEGEERKREEKRVGGKEKLKNKNKVARRKIDSYTMYATPYRKSKDD